MAWIALWRAIHWIAFGISASAVENPPIAHVRGAEEVRRELEAADDEDWSEPVETEQTRAWDRA